MDVVTVVVATMAGVAADMADVGMVADTVVDADTVVAADGVVVAADTVAIADETDRKYSHISNVEHLLQQPNYLQDAHERDADRVLVHPHRT